MSSKNQLLIVLYQLVSYRETDTVMQFGDVYLSRQHSIVIINPVVEVHNHMTIQNGTMKIVAFRQNHSYYYFYRWIYFNPSLDRYRRRVAVGGMCVAVDRSQSQDEAEFI